MRGVNEKHALKAQRDLNEIMNILEKHEINYKHQKETKTEEKKS